MPGKHSAKQKRQAKHIADSERKRGKSPEEAERIGWATVNARKGVVEYNTAGSAINVPPPPAPPPPPPPTTKSTKKAKLKKDLDGGAAYAAMGKSAGMHPARQRARERLAEYATAHARDASHEAAIASTPELRAQGHWGAWAAHKNAADAHRHASSPKETIAHHDGQAAHHQKMLDSVIGSIATKAITVTDYMDKLRVAHQRRGPRIGRKKMPAPNPYGKSFQIVTLDEFLAMRKAKPDEGGAGLAPSAPAAPAPKKFPRRHKPTVQLTPAGKTPGGKPLRAISDEEAMANLRAGKYIEKHVAVKALTRFLMKRGYDVQTSEAAAKALMVGYGRTSGGGALRAPNRGYESDLERAVTAMPPPSPASHRKPPIYLPGVHPTSAKPDRGDGGDPMHRIIGAPPKKKKSLKKTAVNSNAASVNEEGGATELSLALADPSLKKSTNVVNKSEGEPNAMSKTNFNDLFKAELGGEEALCNCPHCEQPITKSDLEKAHGGKGSKTHMSGAAKGKSSAHVRDQNPEGGVTRGGDGHGTISPSRGVSGASKTDAVVGVQNSKGSKTHKAMDNDDSSSDDGSSDAEKSGKPSLALSNTEQTGGGDPMKKSISIRGTEWVQYVDDGSDAAIAKSIAEGSLGGTPPTQPLDLNNDLTRLLV